MNWQWFSLKIYFKKVVIFPLRPVTFPGLSVRYLWKLGLSLPTSWTEGICQKVYCIQTDSILRVHLLTILDYFICLYILSRLFHSFILRHTSVVHWIIFWLLGLAVWYFIANVCLFFSSSNWGFLFLPAFHSAYFLRSGKTSEQVEYNVGRTCSCGVQSLIFLL